MKTTKLLILTYAMSLNTVFAHEKIENNTDFPLLEGSYLGQKLPGLMPEVFAPGIVSTNDFEAFGVFTPDMKEFYFVRGGQDKKHRLIVYKLQNNRWHEFDIGPRTGEPVISPDGKTMHLGKRYMERTEAGGWSELKKLGSSFEDIQIMRLAASSKGTYVFDEIGMPDGDGVIRYSRLIDGKHEEPKPFSKEINSGRMNAHPFIAPDESYLIWDGERNSGYGNSDLYISYRKQDGSWGEAINLGDKINSQFDDAYGSVTPDGKYFFFYRDVSPGNLDIFWVDAQFIEALRPKI